ncbi:hypothetical protein CEB3_c39940 [Peptococcaceae bacterium CEB3]|nr:hypothetical protein CEB3_c39940 [Peptococcaceae bacterium CEB3]
MGMTSVVADPMPLPAEGLVLVAYEEHPEAFQVKVYEEEDFGVGGDPGGNQQEIARYLVCREHLPQALSELREMYTGWAKVERTQPLKIIGIHNEDPFTLFIQFSLGERYFIYERGRGSRSETVREELFGRKHHLRLRFLNKEDEKYLIAALRFLPKAKKAIGFYPYAPAARSSGCQRPGTCGR